MIALLLAAALATPAPVEVTAPGPQGPLAGTMIDPGPDAPLVLVIPGSGPTDRDGNNRLGVAGAPYRQLAEALAARRVASVRIDKRGQFGSKAAVADGNAVTTEGYADDVRSWIATITAATHRKCLWLLGHSEGGLVALTAAQRPQGICGLVLVSAAGRRIGTVMREQLRSNPANAAILPAALATIDALEAGRRVPEETLPAPIRPLFADKVQGYLIDLMSHDPAKLIAATKLPVLILQGDRDLQTSLADAGALHTAQPGATLIIVAGVNHVLRPVAGTDRAANVAAYTDTALPISPAIPAAVAGFVKR